MDSRNPGGKPDGVADALRFLARRPLTERELEKRLLGRGHDRDGVERTIGRLRAAGQIDDAKLARHYVVARAERLGHGPERLVRELVQRGVRPEVARAAWDRAVADGEIDPAGLLRDRARRIASGRPASDRRARSRVYNALLRAGFDPEAIRSELGLDPPDEGSADPDAPDGVDHEFA